MKSIFDSETRSQLTQRISAITENNTALWGKMNAFQMVRHCTLCEDMMQGKIMIKRVFIGRIIGKMILKKALKEGMPFGKNSPTSTLLKTTTDAGDIEMQKKEWLQRIDGYSDFKNENFVHPFFGPMTKDQIGIFVYKHADHHLRQFGL